MNNAINVAQYICEKMGEWIDSWRLQKLTYYSKAWSLAWDGDPIFEEQFEAWPDGPVSKDLFRVNKHQRDAPKSTVLPDADATALPDRNKAVIDAVLAFYGHMNKNELIELAHREKPWMEARDGLAPKDHGTTLIKDATMRETYSRQALIMESVPKAPVIHVIDTLSIDDDVIAAQLEKWADTLDWLSTR